jgi:hypothetical protein
MFVSQPDALAEARQKLVGRRVRLERTTDEYTRLAPGAEGTITFVDSLGTLHVDWDDGSRLGLVTGEDRWTVISDVAP